MTKKDHGHQDIHDADFLVIDRGDPIVQHGRPGPARGSVVPFDAWLGDRHVNPGPAGKRRPNQAAGSLKLNDGIRQPGLIVCGSAIHSRRCTPSRIVRDHARGERLRGSSNASDRGHSSLGRGVRECDGN